MESDEERKAKIRKAIRESVSFENVGKRVEEIGRRKEEERKEKNVKIFCKFCGYDSSTKWGFRRTLSKSIQIYRCRRCGHRFTHENKSRFVDYSYKGRKGVRGVWELENLIITKFKNKQLDKTILSRININKLREELKMKVEEEDLPSPPTFTNKIKKVLVKKKFRKEDYRIIKLSEKDFSGKDKEVELYVFADRQHY